MRRVLVTGGSGFVGQWLTKSLLAAGDDVTVAGLGEGTQPPSSKLRWLPVDMRDASAVENAIDESTKPQMSKRVPWRVGLRVGGGAARVGYAMTLGAAGAFRLSPRLAATARAEWTRRGSGMTSLDALAVAGGVATPLVVTDLAVVTAGGAARGELRLGDSFDMRPVHTLGLAADASLDLVLRRVPIVVGARVTQGITPLVADARETAVLLELGLELR